MGVPWELIDVGSMQDLQIIGGIEAFEAGLTPLVPSICSGASYYLNCPLQAAFALLHLGCTLDIYI